MNDEHLKDNYELIGRALNNELKPVLAGFVGKTLSAYYRPDWWKRGVLDVLTPNQRRNLPREGNYAIFTDAMDVPLCATIISQNWRDIFQKKMSDAQRAWLNELITIRNDWAHANKKKFTDAYVTRAFDTMILFCAQLDGETAEKLRAERQKFQAINRPFDFFDDDDDDDADMGFFQVEGDQPSWCHVIEPKPDVCDGSYKKSEFAADLAAVAAGESKLAEYQDATEFFSRTYLTAGMRRLMIEAMERLVEGNGDPIIEVKTSFGGGKTHSMIALYHLFNRKYNPLTIDEDVQKLFFEARIKDLPKDIYIAVAVGTALNAAKPKDIPELDGVRAHTFMGEVFSQLARAAARFDLYQKYIQFNDERGSSPGVNDLRAFLDDCGACLILIDELVSYGKKLYPGENFEGGNFDQFIVFLQELSEAVRTSDRSMMVVSLPQSEIEIGGEGGREVLRTIEHHFGRLQSVWSPVEVNESFEIVRRRLFQPCRREKERDEICAAYAAMYKRDKKKFPMSTKEARYVNRMKACYPIHPQLFDLLYGKWAAIENFQRTRGVLRLMATIVHKLWSMHDKHSMIMPGAIPLFDKAVKDELSRSLPGWNSIIDGEIDGEDSAPCRMERAANKTDMQPARRLARTIFMGSAPTTRGQNVRGLDAQEIMLGVLTPQDMQRKEFVAGLNNTLTTGLPKNLTFLYSDEARYWFDSRPTLRKVAEQIEQGIIDDDVDYEIEKRLDKEINVRGLFNAKHITAEPSKVPDEPSVRLVILPPSVPFDRRLKDFYSTPEKILNYSREDTARNCKNMLLFLAGDKAGLEALKKMVRRQMAWERLFDQREERNFDQRQVKEIEKNISELKTASQTQLTMTYNHLLEPTVIADDMKAIEWREATLDCSQRSLTEAISDRLSRHDAVIKNWDPSALDDELRTHLFKGEKSWVTLKRLWEYMTQYIYAPRLYDQKVLRDSVKVGVRDGFFGLADDVDEATGEFIGLRMNEPIEIESLDQLIVRREGVEAQLKKSEPIIEEIAESTIEEPIIVEDETEEPPPTKFRAEFELKLDRPSRGIDRIAAEIADILMSLERSEIKMRLVIESHVPDGIPEPERVALADNAQQLKAAAVRFEP